MNRYPVILCMSLALHQHFPDTENEAVALLLICIRPSSCTVCYGMKRLEYGHVKHTTTLLFRQDLFSHQIPPLWFFP